MNALTAVGGYRSSICNSTLFRTVTSALLAVLGGRRAHLGVSFARDRENDAGNPEDGFGQLAQVSQRFLAVTGRLSPMETERAMKAAFVGGIATVTGLPFAHPSVTPSSSL